MNIKNVFGFHRIYADAAAATPIHPRVKRRLITLLEQYANPGALHKEAVAAKSELEKARAEIAAAIGAHPDEIIFTASGTEANNLALMGTLMPLLREHTNIRAVTSSIEHQSVLETLAHLKKYGLEVIELPVDEGGLVSPQALAEAITDTTALVSIQLVNSEVGTIEPIREIAREIRRVRRARAAAGNTLPLLFHSDAAQAPLYLEVKVEKLGVDLMTLDAQKVLGPKGVGILYRKRGVAIEPIMFGGRQESGLRPGTENMPLAGAFAEALTMAQDGVEERATRVAAVRDFLMDELLKRIPNTHIHGPFDSAQGTLPAYRVANNINLSIEGLEGETAVIALDALGIAVSTRSACSALNTEPSHVMTALGLSRDRAREAVRITLLPDATEADALRIVSTFEKVCALYRKK